MGLVLRTHFALSEAWRQRKCLLSWKQSAFHQINQISELSVAALQQKGITLLVLDFDGVLASHGEPEPNQEALTWLYQWVQHWPSSQMAILSNKPLASRLAFFRTHFPDMLMIEAEKPKPYPHGLEGIALMKKIPTAQIALVDDRWLTGMLAAAAAGAQGIYIKKPYTNFAKRPVQEMFFMMLRGLESLGLWVASLMMQPNS